MNLSTTFVAPIGSGFGDVIISLPVIQSLIDQGKSVVLVCRSFRQQGISERVVGLKGEILEDKLRLANGDIYLNLRDHPLQTDHVWGSPEFESFFGPTNMEKIVATIAADFNIAIDFQNLTPLHFNKRAEICDAIAFVPGTDAYHKHWPNEYWLALLNFLKEKKKRVLLIGKPDESPAVKRLLETTEDLNAEHSIEWIATPTAADAIDLISNCTAVVSVDTGLMHTAVQQGIPTFTFIHPRDYHQRSAEACVNFIANDCPEKCGRQNQPKPGFAAASKLEVGLKFDHRKCPLSIEENCMGQIKPNDVISKMQEWKIIE